MRQMKVFQGLEKKLVTLSNPWKNYGVLFPMLGKHIDGR